MATYNSQDDTTTVANHRVYRAFGALVSETDSAATCLLSFTARPLDSMTSLQDNLNRWYVADIARWLSEDPIHSDWNLYRYASNRPAIATDPRGTTLYAIDGTSQTSANRSNVWYLTQRYVGRSLYWNGPSLAAFIDAPDITMSVWTYACSDFCKSLRTRQKDEIDLVGWSRGAVIAATVAKLLNDYGCRCCRNEYYWDGYSFRAIVDWYRPVPVRFVGLFDAVRQMPVARPPVGDWATSFPGNVRHRAHVTRTDHSLDQESAFPQELGFQPYQPFLQRDGSTTTTHSDIGADRTNNRAYLWMMVQGTKAGLSFTESLPVVSGW